MKLLYWAIENDGKEWNVAEGFFVLILRLGRTHVRPRCQDRVYREFTPVEERCHRVDSTMTIEG